MTIMLSPIGTPVVKAITLSKLVRNLRNLSRIGNPILKSEE